MWTRLPLPRSSPAPSEALAGLLILIVEDEMMLATMIEDMVRDLGCGAIKAARVETGMELAATVGLAGAILDINVGGEMVFPIAHLLRQRDIPFIFSSGYRMTRVPPEFRGVPILSKPFKERELEPLLVKTFASAPKG